MQRFLRYVELSGEDAADLFVEVGYSSPQLIETFLLSGQNPSSQNEKGKVL